MTDGGLLLPKVVVWFLPPAVLKFCVRVPAAKTDDDDELVWNVNQDAGMLNDSRVKEKK